MPWHCQQRCCAGRGGSPGVIQTLLQSPISAWSARASTSAAQLLQVHNSPPTILTGSRPCICRAGRAGSGHSAVSTGAGQDGRGRRRLGALPLCSSCSRLWWHVGLVRLTPVAANPPGGASYPCFSCSWLTLCLGRCVINERHNACVSSVHHCSPACCIVWAHSTTSKGLELCGRNKVGRSREQRRCSDLLAKLRREQDTVRTQRRHVPATSPAAIRVV